MKRFWLILAGILAIRLALMAFTPVFDPSESRYAAIAANMARTGDFVVPHFTYRNRYQSFDGKPPLVFQAGGLAIGALGAENPVTLQLGARVFPLFSALLLLLILYHAVARLTDAATGRLAVMICATATAFYAAAGLAMTDMSLTCCVAGALLLYRCFAEAAGAAALGYAAGVAALLGAGMIVKGPVALAMFGLPAVVDAIVNRRWRAIFNWRWLAVAPIFFAIAVPWFVLVEARNPGSVWYFFYNENFLRFVTHDYGDKYGAGREAFRGVAIVWALVATLPWTLLLPLKRPAWRDFFAVSLLTITGFWCLTSRVLLYYLFPMVPLFAAYLAINGNRDRLRKFAPWIALVSSVGIAVALVVGMFVSDKMEGPAGKYRPGSNRYSYEFYHGTPECAK